MGKRVINMVNTGRFDPPNYNSRVYIIKLFVTKKN